MGAYSNFINRLVIGKEKSEGFARSTLPSNRWELFWDILKGNFGKLVGTNLLIILFFLPLVALIFFRYVSVTTLASGMPYTAPFGVGYQAPTSLAGVAESVYYQANLIAFLFLPIAAIVGAIGLAGGFHVMRNLVWTEGVFVSNDFWKGIKQNFKQICLILVIYSILFYISILGISLSDTYIASGAGNAWLYVVIKVLSIVALVFVSLIVLHMLPLAVTYELKFCQLLKNSVIITIANLFTSIIFIALGSIPFIFLLFGDFMMGLATILIIIFGFSLLLLVWTVYCQSIYDKYINDKVAGAKKNRGIYKKTKPNEAEEGKKEEQYKEILSIGMLNSKPIKPITDEELKLAELPSAFNRDDILKLNESRQMLYDDSAKYF